MKKLLLLFMFSCCLFFSATFSVKAQQPAVKDTVYLSSSDIQRLIDDKYYVRVPSNDLDRHLQETVSEAVNTKFNIIYTIIGFSIVIIGGVMVFAMRSYIGAEVKKQMQDEIKMIDKTADTKFTQLKEILDLKIKDYFNENFKLNMDAAFVALKKEQDEFYLRNEEVLKSLNEMRFERIKLNVEKNIDLTRQMDGLKDLLVSAETFKDVKLITRILEELSYVSFYLKKDIELERIIDNYFERTDIDIKETTLVNVALTIMYDYQVTGEKIRRDKAIRYLNAAIRKMPDYGEALALKLEVIMVDYDWETDEHEMTRIMMEGKKLLEYISSKEIAAYETITRLNRVQASAAKSKYIDLIYQLYPKEMAVVENVAKAYKTKLDEKTLSVKA